MKRLVLGGAFAVAALLSAVPASAAVQPPLPKADASFDAGSLHVDRYGAPGKIAVVFIPGLTCGPWEWSREIAQFRSAYTVYALTLPGFDGHAPVSSPLLPTVTADFFTMLQTQHIDRPIVIGHSLGGSLGFMLATQHSDRLRGVISVDGLPVFPGLENQTLDQRAQAANRMSAMMASMSTPAQFEAAERTYSLPYLVTSPDDIASIAKLSARSDAKAAGAWMAADFENDSRPQLANITVPVFLIAPYDAAVDRARFATADAKRAYYAGLVANDRTAHVSIIEHSRHFIMYDQPAQLDAALTSYAAELK